MTDLTDRMRTCAAFLCEDERTGDGSVHNRAQAIVDAIDLLIEASNALEMIPPPLGAPMAIIEAKPVPPPPAPQNNVPKAVWTTNAGDLPPVPTGSKPAYRPPRVCPKCDSRAHKRVFRQNHTVFLACPACAHAWEYKP